MTDDLPPGWAWSTLGQVCSHPQYGWTTSAASSGDLRLLRTTDITSGLINWETVPFCAEEPRDPEQYLLADGDLVVSRAGSVGKSYLVKKPRRAVFASYLIRFRPKIDTEYVAYFLKSGAYWKQISEQTAGIAIPNVNGSKLRDVVLPIAPTPEQARIVSKIDELFSGIEEGERALEQVRKLLERYRQSVLKAAVTGELTRDWREKNKGTLESGEALLVRILKARRDAWEKAELEKMKAKGTAPANDKWKQRYEEPALPDVSNSPELPEGWAWASLDALADVVGGITVDQKRDPEGTELVPYLRVANVQRGYLDLSEIKSIRAPQDRIDLLKLQHGDVLFNEGGDLDKLGRGWIWEEQVPLCIHQNHVFRARLFLGGGWNKIISWYGNVLGRKLFMEMGKQTTNLASLSLSKLKVLAVPLMCAHEAAEIVSRVEDIVSVVDKQLEEISAQDRGSTSLRQTVLKAAFTGRLIAQIPSDEPASALLERIAAEQGTASAKEKRGAKRKTKESV